MRFTTALAQAISAMQEDCKASSKFAAERVIPTLEQHGLLGIAAEYRRLLTRQSKSAELVASELIKATRRTGSKKPGDSNS